MSPSENMFPSASPTPLSVLAVCRTLKNAGFKAFLVGGCVRDAFLGITPKDYDVTTNATPTEVMALFRKVLPTGLEYGTVTVMYGDPIEVTTFRADSPNGDGRRPEAVFFASTVEEDLSRRDFTVNAIAFDPITEETVDPFNGRDDIALKILRAVGDPKQRFSEDGLRILRAVRFVAQKGFELDPTLEDAIRESVDKGLDFVSKERVRDEVLKLLGGEFVGKGLTLCQDLGVFRKVCPDLCRQPGMTQNRHHHWDVWEHTLRCVESEPTGNPLLRLAILLHDIAKPATRAPHPKNAGEFQFLLHEKIGAEMASTWMRKYRFSREEVYYVSHLIKHHLIYYAPDWTDKALRKWLRTVGDEHLQDLLALRRADICGKAPDVSEYLRNHDEMVERIQTVNKTVPHSLSHLALDGKDVMGILGISGGPIVGKILNHLMEAVTENPEVNTREGLTSLVQAFQA